MINILSRCKKLASPVFKSSVLLEQPGILRSASLVPGAHCQCRFLSEQYRADTLSCRHWQLRYRSHLNSKRFYSDMYSENSNSRVNSDVFQEESQDRCQRSLETFSLDVLVSLLRQENGVDICVIKVPEQIKYANYFIVVSGVSPRHLRAMALYAIKVYKFLKKAGDPNIKIEGKDAEDWMCIDFGSMVVHFMLPETREVYELEKLWTLRNFDEQLKNIPPETLPEDFIYDAEVTK